MSCQLKDTALYYDIDNLHITDLTRIKEIYLDKLNLIFSRNNIVLQSEQRSTKTELKFKQKDPLTLRSICGLLLDELKERGTREIMILRKTGHQSDKLFADLKSNFYKNQPKMIQLLSSAPIHDMWSAFKICVRKMTEPILGVDSTYDFYQCYALSPDDQAEVLTILCQLLPRDNRHLLRALLCFLNIVLEHSDINKTYLDQIAVLVTPTLFPESFYISYVRNLEKEGNLLKECCVVTSMLVTSGELLFKVPKILLNK